MLSDTRNNEALEIKGMVRLLKHIKEAEAEFKSLNK